jgi:hypothetical protein
MIYLLYATKVNVGGWTTFTRHLYDSLADQGHDVVIVKLGNRDEPFTRPFGDGYTYLNITLATLVRAAKRHPVIITALGKHFVEQSEQLICAGARVVCHDPAEPAFKMPLASPWVIRRSMLAHLPQATFIRHPYMRFTGPRRQVLRRKAVIATSRVDFDKNTTMILDANRLGANIDIVGFENRLYAKFKIMPHYPEWEQSGGYRRPKTVTSLELLQGALAMVDLTDIKGDGGGTQYTFLEAWDAGAIPIIGSWWLRKGDDMGATNCVKITDAFDLANAVKQLRKQGGFPDMVSAGYRRLAKYHAPKIIVPQVMEWLNAS